MSKTKKSKEVTLKLVNDFNNVLMRYSILDNKEKMLKYLGQLYQMPMTVELLKQSGIGQTVQSISQKHPDIRNAAKAVATKWKNLIVKHMMQTNLDPKSIVPIPSCSHSDKSEPSTSAVSNPPCSHQSESSAVITTSKQAKKIKNLVPKLIEDPMTDTIRDPIKKELEELTSEQISEAAVKRKSSGASLRPNAKRAKIAPGDEIDSQSGTSFADALSLVQTRNLNSNKKLPRKLATSNSGTTSTCINNSSISVQVKEEPLAQVPSITATTSPLIEIQTVPERRKVQNDEDLQLQKVISSKTNRTKVYSGAKNYSGKVLPLTQLCLHVLEENIEAIEYTGGVPYIILKPVLMKATPRQLALIENYNPYLLEDTDELWKRHCEWEYKDEALKLLEQSNKTKSWRDIYFECYENRVSRLKNITANIKKSIDKSVPVRQTKLAIVDPTTRNIRKQKPKAEPETKLLTAVKKLDIDKINGLKTEMVPNPSSKLNSISCSNTLIKPKRAPLMQKTLALIRKQLKR